LKTLFILFICHLPGGLLSRGITEIAGESASGKTQLCMQMCLTVQLPHELGGFSAGIFSRHSPCTEKQTLTL
jgi:RecA/RadA recombinase